MCSQHKLLALITVDDKMLGSVAGLSKGVDVGWGDQGLQHGWGGVMGVKARFLRDQEDPCTLRHPPGHSLGSCSTPAGKDANTLLHGYTLSDVHVLYTIPVSCHLAGLVRVFC